MSIQQMLLGYGGGSTESYWFAVIGDANNNGGNDVAIDNDGNVYTSGVSDGDIFVIKHDKDGTEQWQRLIDTNSSERIGIGLDSSNNVYVVGDTDESPSQGSLDFHITKFNSSGTEQWQKGLGGSELTSSMVIQQLIVQEILMVLDIQLQQVRVVLLNT